MDEQDWAYRFSHDVGDLLSRSGRVDFESLPDDYRKSLEMARTLISADFSHESQERNRLRWRLLEQLDLPGTRRSRKEPVFKPSPPQSLRRRLLSSIAIALTLLLTITFLFPGGPVAAAQSIANDAKLIVLGAYTTAQQIESLITGKPLPDDTWNIVLFPGAGVGGNGPPGTYPTVNSVDDFEKTQELTLFRIREPAYLPEGYVLKEIKLAPMWTGLGDLLFPSNPSAFLFYVGSDPDIIIVQQPVGPQPIGASGVVAGNFVGFGTNGTLEDVEFNGHIAAWADNRLLIWEQDDVSYMVGGIGLSLEEAIRIATSLR